MGALGFVSRGADPTRTGLWVLAMLAALGWASAPHVAAEPAAKVEVVPISGHAGELNKATFTADGRHVLTGSGDGVLKLWEVESQRLIRTFSGGSNWLYGGAIDPNGRRVAAATAGGTLIVWDVASGALLHNIAAFDVRATAVRFSRSGAVIVATGNGGQIGTWDAATGKVLRKWIAGADRTDRLEVSYDDRLVACVAGNTVTVWELATGKHVRTINPSAGYARQIMADWVGFSRDSESIYVANDDRVGVWSIATGKPLRVLEGGQYVGLRMAVSPDGNLIAAAGGYGPGSRGGGISPVKVWSLATGEKVAEFETPSFVYSIEFSPDSTQVLWTNKLAALISDAQTGEHQVVLKGVSLPVKAVALGPHGQLALFAGGDNRVKVVDLASGQVVRMLTGHSLEVTAIVMLPDGKRAVSGSVDRSLRLWDLETGKQLDAFEGHGGTISSIAVSASGKYLAAAGADGYVAIWDLAARKHLRSIRVVSGIVWGVAFSPDGKRVIAAGQNESVDMYDVETGKPAGSLAKPGNDLLATAYSPDGRFIAAGSWSRPVTIWDAKTRKPLPAPDGHTDYVGGLAFSPDSRLLASASLDGTIIVWDVVKASRLALLEPSQAGTSSVRLPRKSEEGATIGTSGRPSLAFSADGRSLIVGSPDSTVRVWNIAKRTAPVTFYNLPDGEWLTMTDAGFFVASENGAKLLSVVKGVDVSSIDQVYERLYSRTLVEEALKGDPEGKHKDAAYKLDLGKLIDSGPAPQLDYLPHRTEKAGDTVRLAVRVTDAGGGIGRKLVWRVNGKSQGEPYPAELAGASAGEPVVVTTALRVDPSRENIVEVVAYNREGLVASAPLAITVDRFGATTDERPRMHVLAVGVDKYRMKDYELRYAVNDARRFAKALETVGSTLFAKVETTLLVNEDVSRTKLAATFERLSGTVKPGDVFVLFLGGHGKSIAERYHFYPQSLDFSAGETVETHGIGHEQWTEWLSKVPAEKTLLVFDTCESTAASGFVRGADSARETAMDVLQHATGRNVITAARNAAYEGYQGHGILTYALLQGLAGEAAKGQPEVRVGALAEYVTARVPQITQSVFGVRQAPGQKVTGSFPLGITSAAVAPAPPAEAISREPTHIVVKPAEEAPLRERAGEDAPEAERRLKPGDAVTLVRFETLRGKDYALVAREGEKLGFLPADAILKINR